MADEYIPIDEFRKTDNDHSSVRIRDMPYGKPRESLTIYPTELKFTATPVNVISAPYPILITNNGYDVVTIKGMKIVGDFILWGDIKTIAPGEIASVSISFIPRRDEEVTGGLYIDSGDAAGSEFVPLSGTTTGAIQNAWWKYDPIYSNTLWNPPVISEEQGDYNGRPPDTEPDVFYNVIIAPGYPGFPTTGTDNDFYSNTFVGKGIGRMLKWSRYTDAFGDSTLKWAKYVERSTILGTLGTPWLGQDLTTDTSRNPAYPTIQRYYEHDTLQDNGKLWTDPTWDAFLLKTHSPGVVQRLTDWVNSHPWVDARVAANPGTLPYTYVIANVVLGRDSFNQKVIGSYCTGVGYRSAGLNLSGDYITAVGFNSNFRNLFGEGDTTIGAMSFQQHQDGGYNFVGGYKAGDGIVHASNNVILGAASGNMTVDPDTAVDTTMTNSIFIGCFSGYGYTDQTITDVLHIRNRTNRGPLIAGDFLSQKLTVGIMPVATTLFKDHRGVLTVYSAASGAPIGLVNTSADELVLENNNAVGMTLLSPSANTGSIYFADPDDPLSGYVQFLHNSDTLRFGVKGVERIKMTPVGIGFHGGTAIAKPTVTGAKGTNAALASLLAALAAYGLIIDNSTA